MTLERRPNSLLKWLWRLRELQLNGRTISLAQFLASGEHSSIRITPVTLDTSSCAMGMTSIRWGTTGFFVFSLQWSVTVTVATTLLQRQDA